jgi:hypothetical protein
MVVVGLWKCVGSDVVVLWLCGGGGVDVLLWW